MTRRSINRIPSLFIAVNPVGSKFAKALQQELREQVVNKVWRIDPRRVRQGRSCFYVTPVVLNKVEQFQRFKQNNVSCPAFTTDRNAVRDLGKVAFARTIINGTNGRGIIEINNEDGDDIPQAPLYTEYIPKKAEYRVHVFGGRMIDIQQKLKKRDFNADDRNTRVRNLHNGYIYSRNDINAPDGIGDLAVSAVNACGYQYGAVDIVYNEKRNQCYVLEVNSRPGLMGTTTEKYADALIDMFGLQRK